MRFDGAVEQMLAFLVPYFIEEYLLASQMFLNPQLAHPSVGDGDEGMLPRSSSSVSTSSNTASHNINSKTTITGSSGKNLSDADAPPVAPKKRRPRVAIIGGGISGACVAESLLLSGKFSVSVFDRG